MRSGTIIIIIKSRNLNLYDWHSTHIIHSCRKFNGIIFKGGVRSIKLYTYTLYVKVTIKIQIFPGKLMLYFVQKSEVVNCGFC
jgi:hypothetical protein